MTMIPSKQNSQPGRLLILIFTSLQLAACGSLFKRPQTPGALSPSQLRDAIPQVEPLSRYGNSPVYNVNGVQYELVKDVEHYVETGIASWYGPDFHGKLTSNREKYDMYAMTAAHTRLPLPCYVLVTNLDNNRQAVVRVNDRGPFKKSRIIDLSYAAATKLDIVRTGTARVELRVLQAPQTPTEVEYHLYVQVGVFSELVNAERMQTTLASKNIRPVVVKQDYLEGKRLYRVQIGPLADLIAMEQMHQRLNQWQIPARLIKE